MTFKLGCDCVQEPAWLRFGGEGATGVEWQIQRPCGGNELVEAEQWQDPVCRWHRACVVVWPPQCGCQPPGIPLLTGRSGRPKKAN